MKKEKKEIDFSNKNICIPIKLYNKHIPSERLYLDCEYMVFGHYDGILIDENIFNNPPSLKDIWEHSLNHVDLSHQNRNYSQQIIYAMRYDENGWEADYNFWNNTNLPFLFLCIMQIEYSENLLECKKSLKNRIIEYYNELTPFCDENLDVMCYFSFENNAIILAIKCFNYDDGSDIINSIHLKDAKISSDSENIPIKYTYTLNGISTSVLNNGGYKQIRGKIDCVHLYAIEKTPGSIDELYEELGKKLNDKRIEIERKIIAGNDDECIIIHNALWKDFLSLYVDEEGILTGNNEKYCDATFSLATHFLSKQKNLSYFITDTNNSCSTPVKDIKICKKISDHLQRIKSLSSNNKINQKKFISGRRMTYYKAMSQILNSLQKFELSLNEKNTFNDYSYFMLLRPLYMLSLAIRFVSPIENEGYDVEKYLSSEQVFRFLNGVTLIAQNSLHSDRQFMQTPDFNAIVYESPAQLHAFYGAFVKKAQDMLNCRSNKKYEFLIVPGLNEYMVVGDIFDKLIEDKRLFILEIPEWQIFDPKNLLPGLLHEIAHKVGSDIRSRKKRDKTLQEMLLHMMVIDMLQFINVDYFENEDIIYELVNFLKDSFERNLVRIRDKKEIIFKKTCNEYNSIIKREFDAKYKFPERDYKLSEYEIEDLLEAAKMTINEIINNNNFIDELWEIYFKMSRCKEKSSYYEFSEYIINALTRYTNANEYLSIIPANESGHKILQGLSPELNNLLFIFSEVYADVICILSLNLSLDNFLELMINNDLKPDKNNMLHSIMIIRIALVIYVMVKCEDLSDYNFSNWSIDDLNDKNDEKNEMIKMMKKDVISFFLSTDNKLYMTNVPQILFTEFGKEFIFEYIDNCIEQYKDLIMKGQSENREELLDIYEKASNIKNIGDFIQMDENNIKKYKESIILELSEITE